MPNPDITWVPENSWMPTEIEDIAIAENDDLRENQTMVVVYAHPAGNTDREVTTQPFGVIFIIE